MHSYSNKDIRDVMGAKYSKPRIRRNIGFSSRSRKRQAPEGSNDPIPTETWNCGNNNKSGAADACKYCGSSEKCKASTGELSATKIADDGRIHRGSSISEDFVKQTGLKVDIPPPFAKCCGGCVAKEKTTSLPAKTVTRNRNILTGREEREPEWTIALRDVDNMPGKIPREEMIRLISSIYEEVDAKVGESYQGRNAVRVRLSITPEKRSQSRLQRTRSTPHREYSECPWSKSSGTESKSKRTSDDQKSREHTSPLRSRSSVQAHGGAAEFSTKTAAKSAHRCCPLRVVSSETKQHYVKAKRSEDGFLLEQEQDSSRASKHIARAQSLSQNQHRRLPKSDEHHPHQKTSGTANQRPRNHGTASQRTRRKEPSIPSPYYQHFHEAMYLRLRELQRQGTLKLRKAEGLQDSDATDDGSDFEVEETKSKVETVSENGDAENSAEGVENKSLKHLHNLADGNCCVHHHHHHHYHHGISGASLSAALNSHDANRVKCESLNAKSFSPSAALRLDATEHHHHHYHHAAES